MMIKCPKCGSEIKLSHDNKDKNIHANVYKCSCSIFGYTGYELEQYWKEYQERLDKVLSKFEQGIENKDYYQIRNNGYLFIDYLVSDNYFELHQGNTQIKISLDTVESLLKDLENE